MSSESREVKKLCEYRSQWIHYRTTQYYPELAGEHITAYEKKKRKESEVVQAEIYCATDKVRVTR